MQSQKSQQRNLTGGGWFKWEFKFLGLFLAVISFSNLIISKNTFALYTPTLSASVDNSAVSVNGNQVINSINGTTELPLRVTVNTNNKTGYTAILNTETNETALVNFNSASGAKIDSIDTNKSLTNFSQNTWGFLSPSDGNYQPIPGLSSSVNLFSTATKTLGNESFDFKIGMKLSENLEPGNYTNKLVLSIVSNPYERRAVMTTGKDFNRKVDSIVTSLTNDDGWGNKESVNHIRRSTASYSDIPAGAIDVENDETSDYPIKIWYDATSKTVFYWTEANKIFLNRDSRYMFRGFTKAEDIDISDFNSSEVEDMAYFFYKMNSLQSLDLSNFNTNNVTDMTGMFAYANSLKKLDLSNFNTSKVTNMSTMFHSMSNLDELNISSFNTENVTNMSGMFYGASKLALLELSNFNTSEVLDMNFMFYGMDELRNLDLSNFNTQNVNSMSHMFAKSSKIISLDISSFNTKNVRNMSSMFYGMSSLKQIDLFNFNTANVTNMTHMFSFVSNISVLDLSSFNTENVLTMNYMFNGMNSLTALYITNFDTRNVEDVQEMFAVYDSMGDNLQNIYIKNDFNVSNIISMSDSFKGRNKLRGGAGSYLANSSDADKSWLRIDDPDHGRPGYFTRKP